MAKWLKNSGETAGYKEIQVNFSQMLGKGGHIFDAAANALVGGTDPAVIRADLFATDQEINETEQLVRRQIVVHGTVHGATSFPSLLVMMSLAKDAERIGDYAKNIFDLAALSPDLGGEDELAKLVELKDRVSLLLRKARDVYEAQDENGAWSYLSESDKLQDECDLRLKQALQEGGPGSVTKALASRYFKRVTSHAANVVTSIVMPLDKLDFFDED